MKYIEWTGASERRGRRDELGRRSSHECGRNVADDRVSSLVLILAASLANDPNDEDCHCDVGGDEHQSHRGSGFYGICRVRSKTLV